MDKEYYDHARPEMLRFVPENRRRVLEVGCGAGRFIASIAGCEEKWGIEVAQAGLKARENLTHFLPGTFESVMDQLPAHHFDLIVCNDVIEHMIDHRRFFKEVHNYLAPSGMLIGSVPNICFYDTLFRAIFDNDWEYVDAGVLDRTHLAFFTTKSLRRTLEETGYQVVRIQPIRWDWYVHTDRKSKFYRMMAKTIGKLSLGRLSHMRYLQIGFQARPI